MNATTNQTTMTIPTCPVAAYKLAIEGYTVPSAPYCRMGQDYDCNCAYCNYSVQAKYVAEAAARTAATAEHRAWVAQITSSYKALAAIGRAVHQALVIGNMLRTLAIWAGTAYDSLDGNLKGMTFKVTGKAGRAKAQHGKVGVVRWVGEDARATSYYSRDVKVTTVLGLAIEGEPKLVYVPAKQCTRQAITAEQNMARIETAIMDQAIKEVLTWTGTIPAKKRSEKRDAHLARCPLVYVTSGRDKGASGRAFWKSPDGKRVGVETGTVGVVWVQASQVSDKPVAAAVVEVSAEERALIKRIAADAAMDGDADKTRELLAMIGR